MQHQPATASTSKDLDGAHAEHTLSSNCWNLLCEFASEVEGIAHDAHKNLTQNGHQSKRAWSSVDEVSYSLLKIQIFSFFTQTHHLT